MADSEFEVFHRPIFETYPLSSFKSAESKNYHDYYSLIPNDELGESPSSKSDTSDQEDGDLSIDLKQDIIKTPQLQLQQQQQQQQQHQQQLSSQCQDEDEVESLKDTNDIFNARHLIHQQDNNILDKCTFEPQQQQQQQQQVQQKRRRKLPEIPKNKTSSILQLLGGTANLTRRGCETQQSITEFGMQDNLSTDHTNVRTNQRHFLSLKCAYLLDEDSSPDSERFQSIGDVDSGHSTAHSPNDCKSMSPRVGSPISQALLELPLGGVSCGQLEMLEATHRGLHKFVPRHHDEIELEIGDGIYVQKEADDLWCEGVNLRTGRQGIFPSAYVVDLDYDEFDPAVQHVKKERYLLGYLGSVETLAHKGTGVVCQAVRKIVAEYGNSPAGQPCILEVSDQGLRMVDRMSTNNKKEKKPCIDYFYSLKNVSFCAFHPRDHRFIGFITKHPTVQRFACHVFKGSESTRPVAEAVGRAFQRFYQKFIETAYPIEDIYLE